MSVRLTESKQSAIARRLLAANTRSAAHRNCSVKPEFETSLATMSDEMRSAPIVPTSECVAKNPSLMLAVGIRWAFECTKSPLSWTSRPEGLFVMMCTARAPRDAALWRAARMSGLFPPALKRKTSISSNSLSASANSIGV